MIRKVFSIDNILKAEIKRIFGNPDLTINNDAYTLLLIRLHQRFDDMITLAADFSSYKKNDYVVTISI